MASSSDVAYVDNYDVFINFRGADTRHGFVKILYDDLVAEGICVFLDDEELNYGKRLDEELPQAINNSKVYITVISETYASSKWCLREIAEIARNKQQFKEKKEILPVFYKIKTDDVKLKTDLFKNQLNGLLKDKKVAAETVVDWGATLKGITDLKAWKVPIGGGFKEDAECCREIVKRASTILRVKHKPLPKDLIGMKDPVEEVMQLLDIKNPGLRVIGIHGMGGSGKTTLAKAVYNKLCDKFDTCCFLPNVRESLDNDKGSKGCLDLQKKLLKEVSYRGDVDGIKDVDDGIRRIQLTLEGKKVILVFDDVSKPDQVVSLIGHNYSMFGRECRIIITTRDDRVLRNREFAEFTKIHLMKAMKNEHALELFSWHAFGEPIPPKEYSLISNDVVGLTGKLPLSLEIIGSLFYRRKNWKQIVEKLKKIPNEDVQERLKVSYEYLEEGTREIFLDIACFFVDKKRSHEVAMWDACDFFSELAIEELISTCLIKIDDNGKYWMHDHIKDLGREIVRQEGIKDMEQRSRIWKKYDAIDILTESRKKENIKIEGILLDDRSDGDDVLTLRGENFVNLERLRFLHLGGTKLSEFHYRPPSVELQVEGSFEKALPNLRWLSLQCMKITRFKATNFRLQKLIVLNFSESDINESWAGWKQFKDLPSLEVLNLIACDSLKKTPDLSYCKSLKELLLSYCTNLEEINRSITSLPKLQHLNLSGCSKLKKLPDSIGQLLELEILLLDGCRALVSLPNSLTNLPKLGILVVSYCERLESLPDSAGQMVQLTEVDISNLEALKNKMKLPGFISKQKKLELLRAKGIKLDGIPTEIEELTCLKEINFDNSSICGLPSLAKLSRLEKLSLWGCDNLEKLPDLLPSGLVELHVSSKSLQSIPDYSNLIHLTNLQLDLAEWVGLGLGFMMDGKFISSPVVKEKKMVNVNWIWRLTTLKKLRLSMSKNYTTTVRFDVISQLYQLEDLTLRCSSVSGTRVVIPSFLSALRKLEITLYRGTTSLSLPGLNRLTHFVLSHSDDLVEIHGLGELESLIYLKVACCNSIERLDDISKLRQLLTVEIRECRKLRVISVVPCQPSLKRLELFLCDSLESLVGPSKSQTKSCLDDLYRVDYVGIVRCPLLQNKLPEELRQKTGRFSGGCMNPMGR